MPDHPSSHRDISALFNERRKTRDVEIASYNEVEAAIRGELPEDYQRLFTQSDVKLQLRTIRAADDSLTKFLSEIPIMPHVPTLGKRDTDTARNKSELVEKIVHGYHNGSAMRGGTEFDGITFQLARHSVRFQDACLVAHPDLDRKLVWLEAKDPRCHFPPVGWHPWSPTPLDGTLLIYELTLAEVKRRFAYDSYGIAKGDVLARLNNAYAPSWGAGGGFQVDDARIVQVGCYRARDAWFVVALSDNDVVLMESQTGDHNHPGACGVVSLKHFATDPLFLGQIGIEAGLMKVLNQQIQNTERINKATTIGPPLLKDELVIGGYNEVNMQLMQGRAFQPYRMAPDSPSNLTQVMGSLLSLAQMFNYNPESNMGGGQANSGKAIQQLQAGPRALVTNILFAPYKPAFPRVYDDCMDMELNLWPNDKKTVTGSRGRQSFEVDYTPSAALQGFKGKIKIENARPGGYNAFIEAVQKRDSEMGSLRDALEADPDTRDVEETMRRIEIERTAKGLRAAFEGAAAQDANRAIDLGVELLMRQEAGKSFVEALREMREQGLLEPPAPPEIPPEMAGGLPPELAGALAGGAPEIAPPSLAAARGF